MYPDKEQLMKVLAETDNGVNNTLVMNTNAEFVAFPAAQCPSGYQYITLLKESVYNDFFVGERASLDENLLNEYMKMAVEDWENYIKGERRAYSLTGQEDAGVVFNLDKIVNNKN